MSNEQVRKRLKALEDKYYANLWEEGDELEYGFLLFGEYIPTTPESYLSY